MTSPCAMIKGRIYRCEGMMEALRRADNIHTMYRRHGMGGRLNHPTLPDYLSIRFGDQGSIRINFCPFCGGDITGEKQP